MLEDLDIDGKKDLILGEWYSSVRFYTNVGTNNDPVFENFIYLVDPDSQQFLNGNPPRVNFTDWDGDNDLDMITACYYGWVYLRRNITPQSVAENSSQITKLTPFTISPNPAMNRVVFKGCLAKPGFVQADVYAVDGRFVASPFQDYVEQGEIEFAWDIHKKLPNGVYLVRFRTDSDIQTQKLLIMR